MRHQTRKLRRCRVCGAIATHEEDAVEARVTRTFYGRPSALKVRTESATVDVVRCFCPAHSEEDSHG